MVSSMSSFSPPSIRQRTLSKSRAFTARCSRKSPGRAVSSASCYSNTHRCLISTAMGIDNVFHPSTPSPPTATISSSTPLNPPSSYPPRSTTATAPSPPLSPPTHSSWVPWSNAPSRPSRAASSASYRSSKALRSFGIAFAGCDHWYCLDDSAV